MTEEMKSYTLEAFIHFLKQAGMEGLMNPAAARARHRAVDRLAGELVDEERRDIRNIDVGKLTERFHKLEGSSIRPETLDIYAERFARGLSEYLDWLNKPSAFITPQRERRRALLRGSEAALPSPERTASERIALEATENPSHIVPIPIREDHVVYLGNLPRDLSVDEAERIAAIVRAYADRAGKRSS